MLNVKNLFSRRRPNSVVQFAHSEQKRDKKLGNWVSLSKRDNSIPRITQDNHLMNSSAKKINKNSGFKILKKDTKDRPSSEKNYSIFAPNFSQCLSERSNYSTWF